MIINAIYSPYFFMSKSTNSTVKYPILQSKDINYSKFDQAESVKVGLIQMSMVREHSANIEKAVAMINAAAQKGANIVCLPELFGSPYFANIEKSSTDYAEELPGATGALLSQAARENNVVLIGGSLYEADAKSGKRFNTALVYLNDGTLAGEYRKMHIPHDPGFYELNYFEEGNKGYKVFATPFGKVAVLICFDQWFPEAARTVALLGADFIFYPTAIGTVKDMEQVEGSWQEAWEKVQVGHAVANNIIVASLNRVGIEGASTFWGGSFVADAFGRILVKGDENECILIAEVNKDHSRMVRDSWRFFVSRRPGTYGKITEEL
jgi:predicted amidohydrolase